MRIRLISFWEELKANFWFIPALMAVTAFFAAMLTVQLDHRIGADLAQFLGWRYADSPDSARVMLSTIASSMITVAGVVFSLMMVVLALASQQYGPMIVRNFIRDRSSQAVLGAFTSTFLYCLLVLRTIRGSDQLFVPQISGLIGISLAVINVAVLIYFIHHMAASIQPTRIIGRIGDRLIDAIETQFSRVGDEEQDALVRIEGHLPEAFASHLAAIPSDQSGYLRLIDHEQLLDLAERSNTIIVVKADVGQYIFHSSPIASVWPSEKVNPGLIRQINDALVVGEYRIHTQDINLLIDQLVSIAVRALSPALNDPFTAGLCIDRLGEALCAIGCRQMPPTHYFSKNGELHLITPVTSFANVVSQCFDEIVNYGGGDLRIAMHLLRTIHMIDSCLSDQTHEETLRLYASIIWQKSRDRLSEVWDQSQIDTYFETVIRALVE
jgi:uncharacterized membrane protein